MAYYISRGSKSDLAVRFTDRKEFRSELMDEVKRLESDGHSVVVTITKVPDASYVKEYKKIYRKVESPIVTEKVADTAERVVRRLLGLS